MNRLPGIKSIAYVYAEDLTPHITMQTLANVPVGVFARLSFLPFDKKTALCETDTELDNNSILETATLTFSSCEDVPISAHLCFIISLVNGEHFLIGTKEAPFPSIKRECSSGLPDGDSNTKKFTITYCNRVALVPIYAWNRRICNIWATFEAECSKSNFLNSLIINGLNFCYKCYSCYNAEVLMLFWIHFYMIFF